jgi:hypothetical protein
MEIVGVARTTRYSLLKKQIPPVVYLSYLQAGKNAPLQQMHFEIRTIGDPMALANTVRRIVHDVGPRVPVGDMTTQSRRMDETIVEERTFADLCTCFGVLALLMACVGLYATMAYAVTRRTNEIGIRMALGAAQRRIFWMVLSEVLLLAGVGLAVGLTATWETTAFLKSFLFGLKPDDPLTLGAAAAERTLTSLQGWIEKHRRLQVNAAKSGTGRVWERKFLGFRLDRRGRIGIAPESLAKCKAKVRELWDARRNRNSTQLRDEWNQYVRGWWGYFQLADVRHPLRELEGWVRRHIRKCFWLRWHDRRGRLRRLRFLGIKGRALGVAGTRRGAWAVSNDPVMKNALRNAVLRVFGFLFPSDLAAALGR